METIKASLQDEHPNEVPSYLERDPSKEVTNQSTDPSERIKQLFSEFSASGLNANEAAAKAINQVATEEQEKKKRRLIFRRTNPKKKGKEMNKIKVISMEKRKNVSETLVKYLSNVKKNPSASKYRCFKVSNKVFDKITSLERGLELVQSVGFEIFSNELDFMCNVPLSADLDLMLEAIKDINI